MCSKEDYLEKLFIYPDKIHYDDYSNIIAFEIYDVKWYNEYSEVNFVENFVFNSEDGYSFVRIGEEFEDVDIRVMEDTTKKINGIAYLTFIIR